MPATSQPITFEEFLKKILNRKRAWIKTSSGTNGFITRADEGTRAIFIDIEVPNILNVEHTIEEKSDFFLLEKNGVINLVVWGKNGLDIITLLNL
jgi:hypothetical protein